MYRYGSKRRWDSPPEQISRLKQRQWGEQRIHVGHFPKFPVGGNKGHKIKHQMRESP